MNEKLANLKQLLQSVDKFAIFCATDFACLLVQYCMLNGLGDKIVSCVVTRKAGWRHTPNHILGVPVVELKDVKESKDLLFVVALLDDGYEGAARINISLTQAGYNNIYFMSAEEFRGLNESLADFSADIALLIRKLTIKVEDLSLLVQSMPKVVETHKKTFGKYKDCHKGQTVVVCASGPSLNKYKYNPDFIHIGVNELIFQDRIKLDYFFQADFQRKAASERVKEDLGININLEVTEKYFKRISTVNCTKFIGLNIDFGSGVDINYMPFGEFSNGDYNMYYFSAYGSTWHYCKDLRYGLLRAVGTITMQALQFALFTNPKRILIVGADGYDVSAEINHYSDEGYYSKQVTSIRKLNLKNANKTIRNTYYKLKDFADLEYPNTEIIMVNPVHFKGIFKEITTDAEGNLNLPD